jgi:lysophospholipase L1-like esterase
MVSGATLYAAPALAQRMPTHVACVGDSITYGYGASSQTMTSYPADLQKTFGSGVQVQNFGHNGATLLSNGSLPYIKQPEYTAATMFAANAGATAVVDVIIMLGTNDSAPTNWNGGANATQYQTDYAALINHFQSLSTHPVVFVALPPPAYSSAFGVTEMVIQDSIVPLTNQVAAQQGAPIIDVYTALSGMPSLFGDGVHPTDMGYSYLAQVMYKGLLQPLEVDAGTGEGGALDSGALEDGTTASPEASAGSVGSSGSSGSSGSVGSSGSAGSSGESGSAEAGASGASGASGGGGSNTAESTGQSGGCTVGPKGSGSRAMPDGCLAAFALLILERRRRSRRLARRKS